MNGMDPPRYKHVVEVELTHEHGIETGLLDIRIDNMHSAAVKPRSMKRLVKDAMDTLPQDGYSIRTLAEKLADMKPWLRVAVVQPDFKVSDAE